jgi:ubiquinone/menaquinone biosynthesis C-methylase UbiE
MRFEIGAELYDAVADVTGRDLNAEARRVHEAWKSALGPCRPTLLDVACGTGRHLERFRKHADVEGADHSGAMLRVAQRRLPDVALHEQAMETLDLPRTFDVITCLLASIAYPLGEVRLHQALRRMRRHLNPDGLLVVEPGPSLDSIARLVGSTLLFEMTGTLVERRVRWTLLGAELLLHHEFRMSSGGRRRILHELHEVTLRDLHEHRVAMERAGFEVHLHRPMDGLPPLLLGRPTGPPEPPTPVPDSIDRD